MCRVSRLRNNIYDIFENLCLTECPSGSVSRINLVRVQRVLLSYPHCVAYRDSARGLQPPIVCSTCADMTREHSTEIDGRVQWMNSIANFDARGHTANKYYSYVQ